MARLGLQSITFNGRLQLGQDEFVVNHKNKQFSQKVEPQHGTSDASSIVQWQIAQSSSFNKFSVVFCFFVVCFLPNSIKPRERRTL
jgi:hypothetical protein